MIKGLIISQIIAVLLVGVSHALPASDLYFSQQWGLHNDGTHKVLVSQDDFHTLAQTGVPGIDIGWSYDLVNQIPANVPAVTVAVIDSGMDVSHPDLIGRLAPGAFDFLLNLPVMMDPVGHGTHVSGIIAATAGNDIGIAGVASKNVHVLPLRVLWATNDPNSRQLSYRDPLNPANYRQLSDYVAQAMQYAVAHGASIVSLSLYWPQLLDSAFFRKALADATAAGVLVVVAAGNDHKEKPTYPCSNEGVLCVGAVTNNGELASFSNFGGLVDILAPGDGIISTYPQKLESTTLRIQGYEILSGTSQAVPFISGMAAVLKSQFPKISVNELKARLFASADPVAGEGISLYGLPNLKKALLLQPQVVFLPDFKTMPDITIDENTLSASGQLGITNLWAAATNVTASVVMNDQVVGKIQIPALASGQTFSVPWQYRFSSLNQDSQIHLQVIIDDSSGPTQKFAINVMASRLMQQIGNHQTISVPNLSSADWLGNSNGFLFSKLSEISSYPNSYGLPRYSRILSAGPHQVTVEITDSNAKELIHQVQIPGVQTVKEIIHLANISKGRSGWVVTGLVDQNPADLSGLALQFYFLDEKFQPFYGSVPASQWIISGNMLAMRSYATPGSWVNSGDRLLPCFLDSGALPTKDNFDSLDLRHYASAPHLFYLNPTVATPAQAKKSVTLELRALDNQKFYTQYPQLQLKLVLFSSNAESANGQIRLLVSLGDDLNSQILLWNIKSATENSFQTIAGWSDIQSKGSPLKSLSPDLDVHSETLVNFLDPQTASLAWSDRQGNYLGRSEFSYQQSGSVIASLVGVFDFLKQGRYWFATSSFELMGYRQTSPTGSPESKTMPLERDTSFNGVQFNDLFSSLIVGTPQKPVPGVYVDSTLVRGNQLAVAVWGAGPSLIKPLRYSLEVPKNCVQMSPVQTVRGDTNASMILICSTPDSKIELQIISP